MGTMPVSEWMRRRMKWLRWTQLGLAAGPVAGCACGGGEATVANAVYLLVNPRIRSESRVVLADGSVRSPLTLFYSKGHALESKTIWCCKATNLCACCSP